MIGEIFTIYGQKVKVVRNGQTTAEECEACVFNNFCENPGRHFEEPCTEYAIGHNRHFEPAE